MSTGVIVLGGSGSGKSTSLRNLDPNQCRLIQCIEKKLPFPNNDGWVKRDDAHPKGNLIVASKAADIMQFMKGTEKPIIIVDDFQAMMTDEFFRRVTEKGYEKFTEIGYDAWAVLRLANALKPNQRVYVLAHTDEREDGTISMKTIGKMVNEKMTPESYFTVVLRTMYHDGKYLFSTRTNGRDPVKTPMGMFAEERIDNDLAAVDEAICKYWGIK
jgi:hypothetical protein